MNETVGIQPWSETVGRLPPQNAVEVIPFVFECVRINVCEVICHVTYPTRDNIILWIKNSKYHETISLFHFHAKIMRNMKKLINSAFFRLII
jgi:hypothetical protein